LEAISDILLSRSSLADLELIPDYKTECESGKQKMPPSIYCSLLANPTVPISMDVVTAPRLTAVFPWPPWFDVCPKGAILSYQRGEWPRCVGGRGGRMSAGIGASISRWEKTDSNETLCAAAFGDLVPIYGRGQSDPISHFTHSALLQKSTFRMKPFT
jgi:hypothetical protein